MKNKILSGLLQAVWVALLVAGLFYPRSAAPVLTAALTWVMCSVMWFLALLGVLSWCAGGTARSQMKASLQKFFSPPEKAWIGWVVKVLIVASLTFSGWLITMVFYLLTIVMCRVMRISLAEPVAV